MKSLLVALREAPIGRPKFLNSDLGATERRDYHDYQSFQKIKVKHTALAFTVRAGVPGLRFMALQPES